ncbi:MAG: hypothetical protein KJ556_20380, partial [Gammaproteobacteria bacterium]|nr:hypothetical protein [Gammaproteobacteria bacterium]
RVNRMTLNRLFPATATLITQLYPVNPKFVPIAKRKQDEFNALVTTSAMNYYYDQMRALRENQFAILSAWFYGFGCTKQGWRTVFKKTEKATVSPGEGMGGKIKGFFSGGTQVEEEESAEYIAEDGPFLNYINNKHIYFDCDQPMDRGKYFTQWIPKTLADIREAGIYAADADFFNRFKRAKDEREVTVDLYEQWHWCKDGMYVMVMCDGYDKPLRYDKVPYYGEGFPFKILKFNLEPNKTYPISNMKVAQQAQRLTDYILTMQKDKLEKWKDLTVFSSDAFDQDTKTKIARNLIDTNVFTKSGVSPIGAAQGVSSNPVPQDMYALQNILGENVREILTVIGARVNPQEDVTATEVKTAEYGNQLRSLGLQERIREWMREQGRKLLQDMKQFATDEMVFQITGMNVIDPKTGKKVTEEWIELGTERSPQVLKDIVPKELDIDIDVTEFARRDVAVVRKQLNDALALVMNPVIQQAMAAEGKKVAVSELVKDTLDTFEALGNADKYIEDLPAPPMMPGMMPPPGQAPEGIPMPQPGMGEITPESIAQGAGAINVPQGGV